MLCGLCFLLSVNSRDIADHDAHEVSAANFVPHCFDPILVYISKSRKMLSDYGEPNKGIKVLLGFIH